MSSKGRRIKQYDDPLFKPYVVDECIKRDYTGNIITCKNESCNKIIAKRYFHYLIRSTDCTIEHKIPLGEGGSNDLDNMKLLCAKCNFDNNKARQPKKIKKVQKTGYEIGCEFIDKTNREINLKRTNDAKKLNKW